MRCQPRLFYTPGGSLRRFFVDGNAKCFQESLILSREANLAGSGDFPRFGGSLFIGTAFAVLALIKTDRRFQNEEHVVSSALNLADRLCNALGVGKRIVDRVSQVLHQALETFFHVLPLSMGATRLVTTP